MPEEKKENKAAAKDSFTFSDKIKNSKPAASKSFANRISSKIGSDGKPKKTLFERTKRDAPFFIAAIVALLLLPFLYKYSGSVDEDPTMVTPATEDTLFDPNRSGFDGLGDPEGQIAQLSGRDSMDLIVGFGNKKEEVSDELPYRNDLERSGFDSDDYVGSSNTAKEYNEKNVYKYKKQAAPATKAAFKKTNINPLRGAGLTSRGGGKLGVGMWGGGLKQAANKVKADAPKSSPKPVSLQPLQAAGKPSRSYFGQGAAAEARRSKDAMSKANAMQALMDAQMKPIEPGKIGGIGGGDFGGPGGGNGNLDRKFAFNGKEPWWWDMMKKRSQMEWEAKFNRKWDWIKWGDKLAQNILGGIINCLLTGDDSGDMGSFLGTGSGEIKEKKCCGYNAKRFEIKTGHALTSDSCKAFKDEIAAKENKPGCGFEGGSSTDKPLGFFGVRTHCLGVATRAGYGSGEPSISESSSGGSACADLNTTHNYSIKPEGEALKWHTYHYIVARNYLPVSVSGTQKTIRLCDEYSDNLRMRKQSAAGVAAAYELSPEDSLRLQKIENMLEDLAIAPEKNKDNIKKLETERDSLVAKYAKTSGSGKPNNNSRKYTANADPESLNDACVVYVAESEILDWERGFKPDMIDLLEQLIQKRGISGVSYDKNTGGVKNYASSSRKLAEEAFEQLDLYMIAGMSSKYKIGTSSNMKQLLPMPYWKFQEAFLERRGTTTSDRKEGGYRTNFSKRKHRQVGIDTVFGAKCYFDNAIKLSCVQNSSPAKAKVTFTPAFQASRASADTVKTSAITLKASYYPGDSEGGLKEKQAAPMPQIISVATPEKPNDNTSFVYTYSRMLEGASNGKAIELAEDSVGTVKWDLIRGGTVIKTVSCDFNNSGDSVNPYMPFPKCTDGDIVKIPATKVPGQCQRQKVCKNKQWGAEEDVPGDSDCEEQNGDGDGDDSNPPGPKPSTVGFYNQLTRIPQTSAILSAESRPGKDGAVSSQQWTSCKLTSDRSPLLALDQRTIKFVADAKKKFDSAKANKDALITLEYNENALTIANLVDAIMIDPDNGTVPANTVCLLGKTIGAVARDPQASSFDNLFGAFLSFISYDAASFPSRRTLDKSRTPVIDLRFKTGTNYWWGGYVISGNREDYVSQIDRGVWKGLPLSELAREPLPAVSAGQLKSGSDRSSRVTYHERYADLMQAAPCQYEEGRTVQKANVLKYISMLCQEGDRQKARAAQTSGGKGAPSAGNNEALHRVNHNEE